VPHFQHVVGVAAAHQMPLAALRAYSRLAPEHRTPGLTDGLLRASLPTLHHYPLLRRFLREAARGIDPAMHPAAATALEVAVRHVCEGMACELLQRQPLAFLPVPQPWFGAAAVGNAEDGGMDGGMDGGEGAPPWGPHRTFVLAIRPEGQADSSGAIVVALRGGYGLLGSFALRVAGGPRAGEEIGHLGAFAAQLALPPPVPPPPPPSPPTKK